MQPVINTGSDFPYDYFWLGVAKNHEALGQSSDEWIFNNLNTPPKLPRDALSH
tara:strand:- start:2172 stop:2330 length:159 start_codon:yes stop_codon:yes gene_type:complete